MNNEDRVVVAEIVRPRGNRGEVLAISQTDIPGRLEGLKRAWAGERQIEVEHAWRHKEFWVLKFSGVDTISAAEEFKGKDVWVPRSERASLPEGEYFRTDLIGCEVREGDRLIGTVDGWEQYGGPPLMQVAGALIPFVEAICRKVDMDKRVIEVDLPEGLLEL